MLVSVKLPWNWLLSKRWSFLQDFQFLVQVTSVPSWSWNKMTGWGFEICNPGTCWGVKNYLPLFGWLFIKECLGTIRKRPSVGCNLMSHLTRKKSCPSCWPDCKNFAATIEYSSRAIGELYMPCIIRFFLLECLFCGIRCGYAKHRPKKHPSSSLSSQRTAEQAYNICHSSSDYISPP